MSLRHYTLNVDYRIGVRARTHIHCLNILLFYLMNPSEAASASVDDKIFGTISPIEARLAAEDFITLPSDHPSQTLLQARCWTTRGNIETRGITVWMPHVSVKLSVTTVENTKHVRTRKLRPVSAS